VIANNTTGKIMSENKQITTVSIESFLELSKADKSIIDIKVSLKKAVKASRISAKLTQNQVADMIESSQSRIAKIEGGDPSVTIDLMIKALLAMGKTNDELALIISPKLGRELSEVKVAIDSFKASRIKIEKDLAKLRWKLQKIEYKTKTIKEAPTKIVLMSVNPNTPSWRQYYG